MTHGLRVRAQSFFPSNRPSIEPAVSQPLIQCSSLPCPARDDAMSYGQGQVSCERLISLVKERPPLYDCAHPAHYNRDVTSRLWADIATRLSVSEVACKTKWANLRSNFVRELRRLRPSDDGKVWLPQWPLFKPLMFLMPYLKPRGSAGTNEDAGLFTLEFHNGKENGDELSSEQSENKHGQLDILSAEDDPDDDKLFMLSLVPKMRQLSTVDNLSFRVEVQQLLLSRVCQASSEETDVQDNGLVMICEPEEETFTEPAVEVEPFNS